MSRIVAEDFGTRRVVEIATTGVDEYLQGIGGDPFGGSSALGLRVPTLATPASARGAGRYLFMLASFSIPTGIKARVLGYRQLATLGAVTSAPGSETAGRFVEMEITTPGFRLPDGNISWHLQRLGPPNSQGFPKKQSVGDDLRSFKRGWCENPALLYEDYTIPAGNAYYVNLTSYKPPNGGKPWGNSLRAGHQTTFYDLRTEWRTHGAWNALDIELIGPDTVALFASVKQSAGATTPNSLANTPQSCPEEQFIAAYSASGVRYWRVAGALILETMP